MNVSLSLRGAEVSEARNESITEAKVWCWRPLRDVDVVVGRILWSSELEK